MSNKHSQESSNSYVDGLKVKISEKYKPPPRIGLPMSYAHRLTLNKQIQDNLPNYEFLLEKTVKEKMEEWKTARNIMFNELKCNVKKAKDELIVKQQKQDKLEDKVNEIETNSILDNIPSTNTIPQTNLLVNNTITGQNYSQLYTSNNNTTTNSILMPLQPANISYSNILKPIPLNKQNSSSNIKPVDKSPFNISDFEADTSSPFDNMELKSINDLEELAQVLKKDEPKTILPNYNQTIPHNNQLNYPNYSLNDFSYNIPNSNIPSSHYIQPSYSRTNGYYYRPETLPGNQSFNNQSYLKHSIDFNYYPKPTVYDNEKTSTTLKSVPHIIKALENELNNTHLDNTKTNNLIKNPSTESENRIYPKAKTKNDNELDETFNSLSKTLQDLSKSISSMGFPLSRVARVCKIIGNDHKKIVEHLLAMSDLLDLGFPEVSVSNALLQCDNDRDKALDVLIS